MTGDDSCGLTPGDFANPAYAEISLTERHSYERQVAVYRADAEHLRVLVEASHE